MPQPARVRTFDIEGHPVRCIETAMNVRLLTMAIALSISAGACTTNSRIYGRSVEVRTAPPARYSLEISPGAATHGSYAKVTVDGRNRVTRVGELMDGRITQEHAFEYVGDAALPHTERDFIRGALTRVLRITRDSTGQVTRLESYTAKGEFTAYTETTWEQTSSRTTNYTKDGVEKWRWTTYYSPEGIRVRSIYAVAGDTTYTEHIWDPDTGLEKSTKVFGQDGRLQNSHVNEYDDRGDLIRADVYDSNGVRSGVWTYDHGKVVKKVYDRKTGPEEIDFRYNVSGLPNSAQFYRGGKLICTFVYEYLADDTIKRTIAKGPDGSVWAEYPNRFTDIVNKDGYPPHGTVGIIYHRDAWF